MTTQANTVRGMSVPGPTNTNFKQMQHQIEEDWPIAPQLSDEQLQAFYLEYTKACATVFAQQHRSLRDAVDMRPLEEFLRSEGPEVKPSREWIMKIYTKLLRDSQADAPRSKQASKDQSFRSSLKERLDRQSGQSRSSTSTLQRTPYGCGIDRGDQDPLDFPDDSYEDEPDDGNFDDEDDEDEDDEDEDDEDYDDEDEDDEDEDDEDDEDGLDEDDDYDEEYEYEDEEHGVVDGYSNHYAKEDIEMSMSMAEEQRRFAAIREDGRRMEEQFRNKMLTDLQKRKQEEVARIQLLQRLRLEDEQRRKRELQERQRKEKLVQEMRRKREAAVADQSARSFLFENTAQAHVDVVKQMIDTSPVESESLSGIPKFATTVATRLTGWEFMTVVEGEGEVSQEKGVQETLLHVAARTGCLELVSYFISKGAPLDSLDSEGRTPLHTAAEHNASLEVCKLLLEKSAHHIDRNSISAGKTALHYAAQNGNGDLVALLLQHHARVNAVDANGNTPEMLAKAGLERASKAKAQMYRGALQHIHKTVAAIKESQRQKDALLQEQRKKEEEMAREEAEKDKAARRKQEEKLEADQRRREEEEKELARLKASATDPHGHNNGGGSGSKKKKKKKNKGGNDTQPAIKQTPTSKLAAAVVQNTRTSSTSPSPFGSPAISHRSASTPSSPLQSSVQTKSTIPAGQLASAKPITSPLTKLDTAKSIMSASPDSKLPSKAPNKDTPSSSSTAGASSPLTRLPKAKTSYRPSLVAVSRMTDMGFPERNARKALIQTEGKFEEAIELLTSGAPLADDSEDEAERTAKELLRKRQKTEEAASLTPVIKQPTQSNVSHAQEKAVARTPAVPSSSTAVKQAHSQQTMLSTLSETGAGAGAGARAGQSQAQTQVQTQAKGPAHASPQKAPINHPVQILQRTHAMAPHVQMRSVPTQVLQRPSSHAHITPMIHPARNSPSHPVVHAATPAPVSLPAAARASTTPFLAPRTVPPPPPTRAPYSYGSSAAQNQKQPSVQHATQHISSHMQQSTSPRPPSQQTPVPSMPSPYHRVGPVLQSLGNHGVVDTSGVINMYSAATSESMSGYSPIGNTWDSQLGFAQMPLNANSLRPTAVDTAYSMGQDSIWGASPLLQSCVNPMAYINSNPLQPSMLGNTSAIDRRTSAALIAASMDEMLRQSQLDMDVDNADEDMIKDVLAMTGAMDPDELLKTFSKTDSSMTGHRAITLSATAVGEGRSSNAPVNRNNPVASLWGFGAITDE
ncbi:hypothetical protein BG011_000644 [Mortierella polycephala]|uniref:UBA domain-containing protein n=1 Tax=Mortierella polycephala TaxID=41804 RepID=A0A9P6U5T5_9FUNG|nr:hypothetical protein BG011_000644 [Mortierella polycephala]